MALFKSRSSEPVEPEPPVTEVPGHPVRKDRPTPSRREAEAARMARLHPELDPKKAKALNREAQAQQRRTQMAAVENVPQRALLRDVVDSRWNIGEIALPVMLAILMVAFVPGLQLYAEMTVYVLWGVIALIVLDWFIMWRKFKRLAAERLPNAPLRGLGFYGWNRQMSFRRWRQPAPRVKRGAEI